MQSIRYMLTPQQLEIISDEYYLKGFLHGRNRLYNHMKSSYPGVFDSRDAIGEWLKYQEVNQFFQYQKNPKVIGPTHKRTEGRAPVWGSEFFFKRRYSTGPGGKQKW